MPQAALSSLYNTPPTNMSRNITYHNLHKGDIKRLVRILRGHPLDPAKDAKYWRAVKEEIHALPHHLRSSSLTFSNPIDKEDKVKPGKLCSGHKGLNNQLIHSVWSALRYEFDRGVGKFLYPILMHVGLPSKQEWEVRQLEPVLEMWQKDFDIFDHTPEGREPNRPEVVVNGNRKAKWYHQENECPACMLARIGSDKYVLSSLLAGMVGRNSSRIVGSKSKLRSKRIRFVSYWLREFSGGHDMADEAFDLGEELRRVRKAWEEHTQGKERMGFYGLVAYTTEPQPSTGPLTTAASTHSSAIGVDISGDFHPGFKGEQEKRCPSTTNTVSNIGIDISDPYSPFVRPDLPTLWKSSKNPDLTYSIPRKPVPAPPAQGVRRGQATRVSDLPSINSKKASVMSRDSTWSWESGVSTPRVMSRLSIVPPPLHPTSRIDALTSTPKPSRKSMYAGFHQPTYNSHLYDGYDVSPPGSPVTEHSNINITPAGTPVAGLAGGDGKNQGKGRNKHETIWSDM